MKTRILHTKIHFEDDWFNTLSIGYRYLFIYLFTNSHIGQTGIYKLSKRVALLETSATEQEWTNACKEFEKANKIKFIEDWIYVINAKKHSNYSGSKNEIAYKLEWDNIPKHVRDTVSIGYTYPMDTTINNKSEIINHKSEKGIVKGELKKDDIKEKEILSFILSFNKLFDTNYQVTDKRRLQLSLRRKRFSYLQIEKALTNLSQSSFHRGKNDRGWCADPDFLIRNDEQVDKWLNTPQENKPNDHMSREEYARLMSTGEMKGKIDPDGYLHM